MSFKGTLNSSRADGVRRRRGRRSGYPPGRAAPGSAWRFELISSCNRLFDHLYTIYMDGKGRPVLAGNVHRLRDRPGETEKITVNIGYVDLGHIDLLVNEGFYSNRTDLIRTAIRNQLATHAEAVQKSIVRQTLELGSRFYGRAD